MVADADTGKVTQALDIGPGPGVCLFDADRGLISSSNGGDGTVAILRPDSPGHYEVAATIKTQVSAKTIAMAPKTHRLYLSAATPNPAPAPSTTAPAKKAPRRGFAPGSFVIVVGGE